MKKVIGLAVAGAAIAASTGVAHADGFSASVNLASDYVFRGLSQTDGGAAIQGSMDYSSGIFYAGAWGSNVNFGATNTTETVSMELDAYAGIRPTTGPINWDIGVIGYFYPNADDQVFGHELDFGEVAIQAHMKLTQSFTLGAAVNYSPDFFAGLGAGWYEELNGSYAFTDQFSLSAAYGHQDVEDLGDYNTWNVGANYALQGFQLGLNYSDTSSGAIDNGFVFDKTNAESRLAFTIGREL